VIKRCRDQLTDEATFDIDACNVGNPQAQFVQTRIFGLSHCTLSVPARCS
jgi:hypothetical protein